MRERVKEIDDTDVPQLTPDTVISTAHLELRCQRYPFPKYRRFSTPMQQTTFEYILTKEEIADNEQFPLLPQYFQLYLLILHSFIGIFHILA